MYKILLTGMLLFLPLYISLILVVVIPLALYYIFRKREKSKGEAEIVATQADIDGIDLIQRSSHGTTLHEAICEVLKEAERPLTVAEIAYVINVRGTYKRKDGNPIPTNQVHARIKNYPMLFIKDKSTRPETISLNI